MLLQRAEALQVLERENFDCILTDLKMPGMNGVEFIIQIEQRRLGVEVVMVTAHASVATAVEAMRHGASIILKNRSTSINSNGSWARRSATAGW